MWKALKDTIRVAGEPLFSHPEEEEETEEMAAAPTHYVTEQLLDQEISLPGDVRCGTNSVWLCSSPAEGAKENPDTAQSFHYTVNNLPGNSDVDCMIWYAKFPGSASEDFSSSRSRERCT